MYAILESGGKQYRVKEGDVIDVELLKDINENTYTFEKILYFTDGNNTQVGLPYVENCLVIGELLGEQKGPKVIAFKYKKRKNYRKKIGHRQKYSRVKITEIKAG